MYKKVAVFEGTTQQSSLKICINFFFRPFTTLLLFAITFDFKQGFDADAEKCKSIEAQS